MKHFSVSTFLLCIFTLTAYAQTVSLIPVPNPEYICRLHPVMDELGTFIPPVTNRSFLSSAKTAAVDVTFIDDDIADPWPQAAKDAFNFAASIWDSHLESPVEIKIEAHWSDLDGCSLQQGVTLGSAGPTFIATWDGSPIANTTYPIALVNALFGSDQAPRSADIQSSFNKDCDAAGSNLWYFGTDGNVPAGKIDFVTVVLHELAHGLGFAGSANYDDGINDTGSGGDNDDECNGSNGAGCFSDTPYVYDRFAVDAVEQGISLLDNETYPNNSLLLGTALTSGIAHFASGTVLPNNGDEAAPLYGPDPWEQGSSYSHLDELSFNNSPHALMTPFLSTKEANHNPGAITCAIFQDMGWTMGPDCLTLLPVEINAFEAIVEGNIISLLWETASETNNARFEVEMSYAGGPFETVHVTAGAGTTTEHRTYRYTLTSLTAGTYKFRIKQIDFDGRFSYSDTLDIEILMTEAFEFQPPYPNPFNPVTQFKLVLASEQVVDIEVVNVTGRVVRKLFSGSLAPGRAHDFSFEAGNLPSGVYWIRATGETFTASRPAMLLK